MPRESHHVFLSYSRKDNSSGDGAPGTVTAFVQRLKQEYFASTSRTLEVFFDVNDIQGMDQWRHKILQHLESSYILLACVSPNYLASECCQWEFAEYLKGEIGLGLSGAGIAPVYAFHIPHWAESSYEQNAPEWVRMLRTRQFFDLRDDLRVRVLTPSEGFHALVTRLAARVNQAEQDERSPGFIDRHNHFFTGRHTEMESLRQHLVSPDSSTEFVILHGLGGIGKTSLAVEYAHSFAHDYPGGRWQAKCGGIDNLWQALAGLAGWLGIEFHAKEPADWAYRGKRVLAELERRAHEGDNSKPRRCLIILDDVNNPSLLSASQMRMLPRAKWLHVIVTSQLGPAELPDVAPNAWFALDRLSDQDAFRLLERLRTSGPFLTADERETAQKILAALGGFTLAIEAAGIFLARFPQNAETLLQQLQTEGLTAFETATDRVEKNLFLHDQKRLTATIDPILERLQPDEWLTLEFASLMPPESVIWEWIEYLVADKFPALEFAAALGEIDRWTAIRERLQSLRLVTASTDAWAGRVHPLVQEVVWVHYGFNGRELHRRLIGFAFRRCSAIENDREDRFGDWELEALRRWALHLMEQDQLGGGDLEMRIAELLKKAGRYREEEVLRRHVLRVFESLLGKKHSKTTQAAYRLGANLIDVGRYDEAVTLLSDVLFTWERQLGENDPNTLACALALGIALTDLADLQAAEPLVRRALEGSERVLGLDHPDTLTALNNLALLFERQQNFAAAEPLYRRALEGLERALGADHPVTLRSIVNLASLLQSQDNYAAAELLNRRALEGMERVHGADHPDTLASVNNLAQLLETRENYAEAERLHRRALEARERVLGPDHPDTLASVNNLAMLLYLRGNYADSEPLFRRALQGLERVLGPDHPHTRSTAESLSTLIRDNQRPRS